MFCDIVTPRMFCENVTMTKKVTYQMTQEEIKKLNIINQTIDGYLTIRDAARALNLSDRQIKRLKKGVQLEGPSFVIHKSRGKKPDHSVPESTEKHIISLKLEKYPNANFTHFTELLNEREKISISRPVVHRILSKAGISSPKKHKKSKSHHRRKRKDRMGLLVQIDASPYDWFDTGFDCDLHAAIDDATGALLGLFFVENECLEGYFQIMHQLISNYGIPASLYSDKHTIFRSPKSDKLSIDEQLAGKQVKPTQFGAAMEELGVTIIPANSPQAKGRVERLFDTLQSRLPTLFKLHNITTMEKANEFLQKDFLPDFNKRFALKPENELSAFTCLNQDINLDHILCSKFKRTVDNSATFSFEGSYYQILDKNSQLVPKSKVTVLSNPKFGVKVKYKDMVFETQIVDKPSTTKMTKKVKTTQSPKNRIVPDENHPWRKQSERTNLNYDLTDQELLDTILNTRDRV
ncbi:ISNCY family transposase [Natranaerobius thermophilus]|nr:ISNCY family transposase [Natranaerobius thermophilus]